MPPSPPLDEAGHGFAHQQKPPPRQNLPHPQTPKNKPLWFVPPPPKKITKNSCPQNPPTTDNHECLCLCVYPPPSWMKQAMVLHTSPKNSPPAFMENPPGGGRLWFSPPKIINVYGFVYGFWPQNHKRRLWKTINAPLQKGAFMVFHKRCL